MAAAAATTATASIASLPNPLEQESREKQARNSRIAWNKQDIKATFNTNLIFGISAIATLVIAALGYTNIISQPVAGLSMMGVVAIDAAGFAYYVYARPTISNWPASEESKHLASRERQANAVTNIVIIACTILLNAGLLMNIVPMSGWAPTIFLTSISGVIYYPARMYILHLEDKLNDATGARH